MKGFSFHSYSKAILAAAILLGSANASGSVPNDDFANATIISGESGTTTGNNTGATPEIEEDDFDLQFSRAGASIWWRWTAPESGDYTFNTFGSGRDTVIAVFSGSAIDDLMLAAQNDDSGTGNESKVTFTAEVGTVYFIWVDSFSSGDLGEITLNWSPYILTALDAPTMVYNFRGVYSSLGKFDASGDYNRKSTSVLTGLVVRGRNEGARVVDDRYELGPVAFIRLFSYREGRATLKRYEVETSDSDSEWDGFGSELIRTSLSSKGVTEKAFFSLFSAGFYGEGRASLAKVFRSQAQPTWFAKKLKGKGSGYFAASGVEFTIQGEPIPGALFTNSDTLTFNAGESAAVAGQDFEDALATIIQRIEAKGYVLFVPVEE